VCVCILVSPAVACVVCCDDNDFWYWIYCFLLRLSFSSASLSGFLLLSFYPSLILFFSPSVLRLSFCPSPPPFEDIVLGVCMKDSWRRLVGFEEWDTNHDGNLSVRLIGCLEVRDVLIAPLLPLSYLAHSSHSSHPFHTSHSPLIPLTLLSSLSHSSLFLGCRVESGGGQGLLWTGHEGG
jgi:hypothetical protein